MKQVKCLHSFDCMHASFVFCDVCMSLVCVDIASVFETNDRMQIIYIHELHNLSNELSKITCVCVCGYCFSILILLDHYSEKINCKQLKPTIKNAAEQRELIGNTFNLASVLYMCAYTYEREGVVSINTFDYDQRTQLLTTQFTNYYISLQMQPTYRTSHRISFVFFVLKGLQTTKTKL